MNHQSLLAPLEALQAPETLSGCHGSNRAPSSVTRQIEANDDLSAIHSWLEEFTDSPQTHRNYRKEAERLLLWSLIECGKPLSSLTRDDLRAYQKFLVNPEPINQWCGPRAPRHSAKWRPFQGPLSLSSQALAMTVINALFSYLVEAGYLAGNPLGLMRRKLKQRGTVTSKVTERFLEQRCWQAVVAYIEQLPQQTLREQRHYERIRYLFTLLYLLGPRVSEVAGHTMGSMRQLRGKWWWQVTGKGSKTQSIPVNETMLQALIRYRRFYGLSELPQANETTPLFLNLNGTKGVTGNMVYRLVKQVFQDCAAQLADTQPQYAETLSKASTHWLRHTAFTHQTDAGIALHYIKRNARHESVETTMRYQHAEEDRWHEAMTHHTMPESS